MRRASVLAFLAGLLAVPSVQAQEAPCAACAVLHVPAEELSALLSSGLPLQGLDLIAPLGSPEIDALAARGARVWGSTEATDGGSPDPLSANLTGVVLSLSAATVADADRAAFVIKQASSAIRGEQPAARIALRVPSSLLVPLASRAVAAYLDAVVLPAAARGNIPPEAVASMRGIEWWVEASPGTGSGTDRVLRETSGATDPVVLQAHGDALALVGTVAALRAVLPQGLTPLPDVVVTCDACRDDVWLHPETLDAVAVVRAAYPIQSLTIRPGATRVALADPRKGDMAPISSGALPQGGTFAAVPMLLSEATLVVRVAGWRGGDETVYRTDVQVAAPRQLTVEEILARHQAQRARQAAVVRSSVSTGTTVLIFEVPAFAGPVTITAQTTVFARGALTEIAQQNIEVNGVDLSADGRVPKLPLIEPERVSTPPLTITLTAAYRYRLAGRERCGERECHVVEFEPATRDGSSFSGRAWIDTLTFGLARMRAAQTGLSGPIVSNEQRDELVPREVEGSTVWLTARSESFQVYQAAGLRTPIHRRIDTPVHVINPPDFEARRADAHASRWVMLRDTPEGFRYLVPSPEGAPGQPRIVSPSAGRRVVTLAFGVLIDPNITVPLPYAGVSYLDFDFLGSGALFSGFFGGSYGQAAWTIPRFLRPGWQLTGQAFGIGVSYNDRSFLDGRERYDENIRQRPFHADTTLVVPLAPRVQLRAGYEFDYTSLDRGPDTASDFVVPNDAMVHGARLALDVQQGPWTALAWWNPATRVGWKRWGRPTHAFSSESADFQRYGATLGRSWVLSPASVARVEGSWISGRQLDRFSRYSFDGFTNRLRGYPSASVRYDRGAVVRSVATWTPAPQFRLDGFFDYAAVHDPGFGRGLRSYPGVGAALEVPLPQRMLVAVEWGYGFEARNTDGSRGTHVIKVSGFKVF